MNTSSRRCMVRLALGLTLAGATSMASACSGGKENVDTSRTSGAGGSAPGTGGQAGSASARALKELPKPMQDLANAPQEFVDHLEGYAWRGHIVPRKCAENGCSDSIAIGAKATIVKIEAIEGANELKLDSIPTNGFVIGRLINLGPNREKYFDLPRNSGEWYVVVTKVGITGATRMRLWNLTYNSDGTPKLAQGREFPLQVCHRETIPPTEPDAGFKDCSLPSGADRFAVKSFDRGAWFTCSVGCCTSDSGRGGVPGDSARADSVRADSVRADSAKKRDSTARPTP